MKLILAKDFETVKNKYIEVINNTPQIQLHARWVYGKHPTDEMLRKYIERNEMYQMMNGADIAGMVAISLSQSEEYDNIVWQYDFKKNQVATLHILAVCPNYRGHALGIKIINLATDIVLNYGKKVLRLDVLKSNTPAQHIYEKAGFIYSGKQKLYAENTGITDFMYYEKILTDCNKN